MEEHGLVGAVRLSDREELDQPDPLILSAEEVKLMTWRHFETLLKSMYRQPPETIEVKYLDDENDWIEMSSEAELAEALKYTKDSGEILQLLVKSLDPQPATESLMILDECPHPAGTHPSSSPVDQRSTELFFYIPTTDPGGDVHNMDTRNNNRRGICGESGEGPPAVPRSPLMPATIAYPPDLSNKVKSMEEMMPSVIPAVKLQPAFPLVNASQKEEAGKEGERLVYPSAGNPSSMSWDQASSLSSEGKLRFLKSLMESQQCLKQSGQCPVGPATPPLCNSQAVPCPDPICLGRHAGTGIANQDPFETAGDSSLDARSPGIAVLTPTQVSSSQAPQPGSKLLTTLSSSSVDGSPLPPPSTNRPPANGVMIPKSSKYTSAVVPTAKLQKKSPEAGVPIPMPRNLLMMEGAQSGANAVAIEMPSEPEYCDGGNGGVSPEEEIAASGGAASTAASEETGEVMSRGGSHAASVPRQPKTTGRADSCAEATPNTSKASVLRVKDNLGTKHTMKKRRPSPSRKQQEVTCCESTQQPDKLATGSAGRQEKVKEFPPAESETYGVGARPKVLEKKKQKQLPLPTQQRRGVPKRSVSADAGSGREAESEDVATTTPSASLEKSSATGTPEPRPLLLKDFVSQMRKLKKELHSCVVKDVAKQTDKLLKKRLSRSLSQGAPQCCDGREQQQDHPESVVHKLIICDICNLEIVGVRYKCGNCRDYDLCEKCEEQSACDRDPSHDPSHVFLKLRRPARLAGRELNRTCQPLLRENIYKAELEKQALARQVTKEMKEKKETKKKARARTVVKITSAESLPEPAKGKDTQDGENTEREPRASVEMSQILEKMAERQIDQERSQPRDWSPYEEVPLKMNTPADLQELFDMMWQEKQKLKASSDEAKEGPAMPAPGAVKQWEQMQETREGEKVDDDILPVSRDRSHSESSGSSIVPIQHPTEMDGHNLHPLTSPHMSTAAMENLDLQPLTPPLDPLVIESESEEEIDGADEREKSLGVAASDNKAQDAASLTEVDLAVPGEEDAGELSCGSDSSYVHYYESDSSEDFCVIDHPGREGYEEIGESDEEEVEVTEIPSEQACTQSQDCTESLGGVPSLPVEDENNNDGVRSGEEGPAAVSEEEPVLDTSLDDRLVHPMTAEEKFRFQELLQAEVLRQAQEEDQKKKQVCEEEIRQHREMKLKLEQSMKDYETAERRQDSDVSKQATLNPETAAPRVTDVGLMAGGKKTKIMAKLAKKKRRTSEKAAVKAKDVPEEEEVREGTVKTMEDSTHYQEILEVKWMQAMLENERLEEASLEQEARRAMEEEEEEWKKQRALDPAYYRLLVTDRRVGQMLELEVQKFAALDSGDRQALEAVQRRLCVLDQQRKLDEKKLEIVEREFKAKKSPESCRPSGTSRQTSVSSSTQCDCCSSQSSSWEMESVCSVSSDSFPYARDAVCQGNNRSARSSVVGSVTREASCQSEGQGGACHDSTQTTNMVAVTPGSPAGDGEDSSKADHGTSTTSQASVTSMTSQASNTTYSLDGYRRDANCQTTPSQAVTPAGHLIQSVAFGMSKAASSAFSTAKDVFYSLQAKQNEWKASPSTWKPPTSTYVPPTSKWTPPEDTWTPPEDTYRPPQNTYVPPTSEWTAPPPAPLPASILPNETAPTTTTTTANSTPKSSQTSQKSTASEPQPTPTTTPTNTNKDLNPDSLTERGGRTGGRLLSSVVPSPLSCSPFESLDIADVALRREVQGMQRLIEMGFANREKNRTLLAQFDCDLEKVVQALLQEEVGDHWAFQRH